MEVAQSSTLYIFSSAKRDNELGEKEQQSKGVLSESMLTMCPLYLGLICSGHGKELSAEVLL
jgi:hypothetical protein